MPYRYDTHVHTHYASACGLADADAIIACYLRNGYAGIMITDHFFNGNCAIDRALPWEEKVAQFCAGYEHVKAVGDRDELRVFFGFEYNFGGTEFLIYGLDKAWLLAHPEIMNVDVEALFALVDAAGGLMIHAHPCREAWYIPEVRLFPHAVHGAEVYNAGNLGREGGAGFNDNALAYARAHNLPMTSGTDFHAVGTPLAGMEFDAPLDTVEDFIRAVKQRAHYRLLSIDR